ncbi:MAG: ADP-ribosylation factor-like protein [Candidatus Freyarchaeum deiterrae]
MIYGVFTFDRFGRNFYQKFYGNINFDQDRLFRFVTELTSFVQDMDQTERIGTLNLEKLKFVYSIFEDMISVICSDQKEDEIYLTDKIVKVQVEFLKLHKGMPRSAAVRAAMEKEGINPDAVIPAEDSSVGFEDKMDAILFPYLKIVILGQGGVGKTTIRKLIMGEEQDPTYIPTVGVDVKEFGFESKNMRLVFWDFSGQQRYRKLWKPLLEGADIVVLVTDSTVENLEETKRIYQLIKKEEPKVNIILIANKQDLPDAIPPEKVGKYLGLKAHGLVATDLNYIEKMMKILKETINKIIESRTKTTTAQH